MPNCEESTLVNVLKQETIEQLDWLDEGPPFAFDRKKFFGSRTLYYPGSGSDGHPVSLGARSHSVHTFVYVDSGWSRENIRQQLYGPDPVRFRGYIVKHEENIGEEVLRPGGWAPHVEARSYNMFMGDDFSPYALFVVLQRDKGFGNRHGPKYLAGLFIGGDGFATYDALYCQNDGTQKPYLVVLHNGGFQEYLPGQGGLLEQIAVRSNVLPRWLLVSTENTKAWNNYKRVESFPECGGGPPHLRFLFTKG